MSKKALDTLTETMFYVLMAFSRQDMCGTEIADYVRELTNNRVSMGPGTLYTILSNFQKEKLIERVSSEGRRITYSITEAGSEEIQTCPGKIHGTVQYQRRRKDHISISRLALRGSVQGLLLPRVLYRG